jgi:hypothetical protein
VPTLFVFPRVLFSYFKFISCKNSHLHPRDLEAIVTAAREEGANDLRAAH